MRTYGRDSMGIWVEIDDPNYVQLATLVQTLRLQQGESPYYGSYGIPAQQSVLSQIAPDAAVSRTQSQFSQYFASLSVARVLSANSPTYTITAIFLNGTIVQSTLAT